MTCETCADLLGDAVDGSLASDEAAAVREHCARCAACNELLNDLLDIRRVAATLERRLPSPHLRDAIQARLTNQPGQPAQRRSIWMPLAMAASLLLVLGTASWLYIASQHTATPDAAAQLASAQSELQQAEQHYLNAITALELLTAGKDTTLDPQVADAIAQSLRSIDSAIGDSRAALKGQPDSILAQTSLLEALRMKVALLQETVSLLNARS